MPDNQTGADLDTLAEAFRGLSIGEYKPREQIPQTEPLVTHTLIFKDGSSAKLHFFDRDEEQGLPPYLDIVFGDTEPSDATLQNARKISMQYSFSLSWIDPAKYLKECGDFFIDPPAAPVTENSESAHDDCADCPGTSE